MEKCFFLIGNLGLFNNPRFIFWGAGSFGEKKITEIGADSVIAIIDKSKVGEDYDISNEKITIQPIESLNKFSPDEAFLCIATSEAYVDEIKKEINTKYAKWQKKTVWINDIDIRYCSLTSLFKFDSLAVTKANNNIKNGIEDVIIEAENIIEQILGNKTNYNYKLLGKTSSRVIVAICKEKIEYVMHFPSSNKIYGTSIEKQRDYIRLINEYGINKNLVVYIDERGYDLQKYADFNIDWDVLENYEKVISYIKKIHHCALVPTEYTEYSFQNTERVIDKYWSDILNEKSITILQECIYYCKQIKYKPVLIHGDLHCDNICKIDDKIEIIDWTSFNIGNGLRDIISFLCHSYYFFNGKGINKWEDALDLYYGREMTHTEELNAHTYMICFMFDCIRWYPYYRMNKKFCGHLEDELYIWSGLYKGK